MPVNLSVTARLTECGKMLGEATAKYLKVRSGPKVTPPDAQPLCAVCFVDRLVF